MFEELGISFGTALIVLLALYFIVKWAVKNGIKEAYRDITGKVTTEDIEAEQICNEEEKQLIKRGADAMPGILVVEDDENLNRGITFSLKKSGYEVKRVKTVDMFPWSGHVETVCLMSRK